MEYPVNNDRRFVHIPTGIEVSESNHYYTVLPVGQGIIPKIFVETGSDFKEILKIDPIDITKRKMITG